MADKTHPSGNALMDFDSEGGAAEAPASGSPTARPDPSQPSSAADAIEEGPKARGWLSWFLIAVLALVGIAATSSLVALGPMGFPMPGAKQTVTTGRVTFETDPAGTEVVVDGTTRGFTPLTLRLDPGHHDATIRHGKEERPVSLEVNAGGDIVHRVEFAAAPPTLSRLSIVTEPSGARVVVDGEPRGVSPLTVPDLAAGRHRIVVSANGASADRTVTTEPGVTTSVVFSLAGGATPEVTAGWINIDTPFEVRAIDKGEVIGTSAAARIMLPPGTHEIDFVNTLLGFQTRRRVDVVSGRTTAVKIDARAPVNVNANPWAEVTVDGTVVGTTPIANLVLTLGNHTVLFRHSELGEQRQDIVVTAQGPNRISADLTR